MNSNKWLAILLSGILLSGIGTAFSAPEANDSNTAKAFIMTTLNNGPVMNAIELEIRQTDANNKLVEKTHKHTTVLALTPGTYMATAKMDNVTRYRQFSIIDQNLVNIVIAMDAQ
ncbi:hypothetical protein [Thiothrix nivea]|uniref:Uncharacterized protein n=1 Tax=Thiothrix nivea (strain ATCC 35100 / DSM 5205 / JP2) TaxID=870187 RepID=A0A656HAE0_THINJ|nr:hypothetical protein [Thiothrix nivea]EIJ33971.1 hypothetical protein Thini_1366 [Thiothrix nivea DSM 5205]